MIKAFYLLMTALPDILKLLQFIDTAMKESETKGKVKDGVRTVHEALASGDNDKLNSVFNGAK